MANPPRSHSSPKPVVVIALCAVVATLTIAADWPQFRGPERTGVGEATGLADAWPEGGPPVRWQIETLGEGYGSVAVMDDVLYVQGTAGGQSVVFALSADDGRTLWRRALGPRRDQDQGAGPRSTPTVVGDGLYVLNEAGELAYLDRRTGEGRWQFNILERLDSSNISWSVSESPLVDAERVYVMPGGRGGSIAAVDRKTGETVWRSRELTDAASYSSLVFTEVGGVRAIAGFTQE
mgnify:FL=1